MKRRNQTITVSVSEEEKTKAAYLAKLSCRSLSGYLRQLLRQKVRDYEAVNGPISDDP